MERGKRKGENEVEGEKYDGEVEEWRGERKEQREKRERK